MFWFFALLVAVALAYNLRQRVAELERDVHVLREDHDRLSRELNKLQPQIADIVQRLSKIPFDDIARGVQGTLAQVSVAVAAIGQLTPEAQKALVEVQRTLTEVQRTLTTAQSSLQRLDRNLLDDTAPVQRSVDQTLSELQRAAQSLRVLTDYLQLHPEALLRGKPADPTTLPDKRTP